MRYTELIEGVWRPLVIVDVQPEYQHSMNGKFLNDLMRYVNRYRGQIVMLVNAEETGVSRDTEDSIKYFWMDYGLSESKLMQIRIIDKGYSYLRGWMDHISKDVIVRVGRFMVEHNITDSRDIEKKTGRSLEEVMGDDYNPVLEGEPMVLNWLDWWMIRNNLNNARLCGGARNECLKEVQLLFEILNVPYSLINRFVYD